MEADFGGELVGPELLLHLVEHGHEGKLVLVDVHQADEDDQEDEEDAQRAAPKLEEALLVPEDAQVVPAHVEEELGLEVVDAVNGLARNVDHEVLPAHPGQPHLWKKFRVTDSVSIFSTGVFECRSGFFLRNLRIDLNILFFISFIWGSIKVF